MLSSFGDSEYSGCKERLKFRDQSLRLFLRHEVPGVADHNLFRDVGGEGLHKTVLRRSEGSFAGNREYRYCDFSGSDGPANRVHGAIDSKVEASAGTDQTGTLHRFYIWPPGLERNTRLVVREGVPEMSQEHSLPAGHQG